MKWNSRQILKHRKMRLETHGFQERKNAGRNGYHWIHPQYIGRQFSLKEAEERCDWLTDMTCRHLQEQVRTMRRQLNQCLAVLSRHGALPQYKKWADKFFDDEAHMAWDKTSVPVAGEPKYAKPRKEHRHFIP